MIYSNTNLQSDISHADGVIDSCKRGQKIFLVKQSNVTICTDVQQKYRSIVEMDPVIEKYPNAYAKDLEEQLGIGTGRKLPKTMSVPTLLNPMIGLMPEIVGA